MVNEKPITGRNNSFLKVIEILNNEYNEPITIVETGCIRNVTEESKIGDGWSTLNWDHYSKKTDSEVYVVDINEGHINQSKKIVPETELLKYYMDDSVNFLQNFNKKIDLLFIDSFDFCGDAENIRNCHLHSLNEIKAAWDKLNDKCFILIDDVFNDVNWAGKGELSIPYLLENGFEIVYYIDSQVLLKRTNVKYLNFFSGVYYINLDSRTDRKEQIEKNMKGVGIVGATHFSAIQPEMKDCTHVPYWSEMVSFEDKKKKANEVGCSMSHIEIIKDAKKRNLDNVLILEDDCVFLPGFKEEVTKCVNDIKKNNITWDIIWFGGEPNDYCNRVSDNLFTIPNGGVYCLHCYAVNKHFYDDIINMNFSYCSIVDIYLINYGSHKRTYLLSEKLLATQESDYSDLRGQKVDATDQYSNAWKKYVKD